MQSVYVKPTKAQLIRAYEREAHLYGNNARNEAYGLAYRAFCQKEARYYAWHSRRLRLELLNASDEIYPLAPWAHS